MKCPNCGGELYFFREEDGMDFFICNNCVAQATSIKPIVKLFNVEIRNKQKKRKGPGRPKKNLDRKQAKKLQLEGRSLQEIADIMECGKTTVHDLLRKGE